MLVKAAYQPKLTSFRNLVALQALTQWLEKNAPFITILLIVFVSQHILGKCFCHLVTSSLAISSSKARSANACMARRVVCDFIHYCHPGNGQQLHTQADGFERRPACCPHSAHDVPSLLSSAPSVATAPPLSHLASSCAPAPA